MPLIKENMDWPITGILQYKAAEHSVWYAGEAVILADFYTTYQDKNIYSLPYYLSSAETFWGRQVKNKSEIQIHVPVAGDIAETSANFLFGEAPLIKVAQAHEESSASSYKKSQDILTDMLTEMNFNRKLLESAESCAAIGGIFVKLAWDKELSPYPIPVIVQADRAIPEFKFGILQRVVFWKEVDRNEQGNRVWRLLETYERGRIISELYIGSADKLGYKYDLTIHPDTADIQKLISLPEELFAVYIPNILPNRIDRNSYLGRSDYLNIEGLMDSLDETFSSWMKDIALAQAKVLLPESFLQKDSEGRFRHNIDRMLYVKLDMDPTLTNGGELITPQQFDIRAEQFEKTSLNLLERIITSAGYSPQSFGLNIQGRAESGTALSMRERKSFATKSKKEKYWGPTVKRIVELMIILYASELGGGIELDSNINVAFSDGFTNDLNELASSVKMLSDAMAVSTETKVRLLHPEWEEDQIQAEVQKVNDENGKLPITNPDNVGIDDFKIDNNLN